MTAKPKAPPVSTRFCKGQSGNPKGRPKKPSEAQAQISAFDIVIDQTLSVVQNGKARDVTLEEALQHKTYRDAIAGNRAAQRDVLKMIAKREKAIAKKRPPMTTIERAFEVDSRNADEALMILGIACRDQRHIDTDDRYDRLQLEPWAVEAALCRRARIKFERNSLAEAMRCTRDPNALHWPAPKDP